MRNRILIAAVPLVALVAAVLLTRDSAPAATSGGHDHSTMAQPSGAARPVSLTADQARRIGVTFAAVEATPARREIRTVGQVTFDETRVTTISPKVDGWVERLHVDFTGRPVRRGEPLFALYSPMLVAAQEELLLAHQLTRDVSTGSADTRAGAAELITSARRRLAYWDVPAEEIARIERTGQVQRTVTLRAATSGMVIEKNVTEGQRVMAGDRLYKVADLATVWVEGEVYEQDLAGVREGQTVGVELTAWPGQRRQGRIAYVYPTLSPETRTARVRVEIANRDLRVKPGMYATLHIAAGHAGTRLTIPRNAVLITGERQVVFVRRADGQLEPRAVQVGATFGDRTEILRGLAAGEQVVATATFLVDAESNLGAALDGMADAPVQQSGTASPPPAPAAGAAPPVHQH